MIDFYLIALINLLTVILLIEYTVRHVDRHLLIALISILPLRLIATGLINE